jgi:hypothetical protein
VGSSLHRDHGKQGRDQRVNRHKQKEKEAMIRIPFKLAASLLAGALAVAPAMAQTPTPDSSDGSDRITITGIQPERMRDFVRELMEPGKLGQLSRWEDEVCPGVVGLTPEASQAMLDRIALRAVSLDLRVGEPGCKANVLVVVTDDGQQFTPTFVQQNKKLFGDAFDSGNTLGKTALDRFTKADKPVRWWHVSQTVTDRGKVLGDSTATAAGGGGFSGAQVARVNNASRLGASTHQEFNRIIAIVDTSKTKGVSFSAVADYIAMIALTQVQADVDAAGYDSILNVFDGPIGGDEPMTGWTAWDSAFVSGLYAVRKDFVSSQQLENEIVRQVTEANAEEERKKAAGEEQKS